jgi:hypothetical protein
MSDLSGCCSTHRSSFLIACSISKCTNTE